MTCREEERLKGGAYPKSCPTCKFGPCPNGYEYGSKIEPKIEPAEPVKSDAWTRVEIDVFMPCSYTSTFMVKTEHRLFAVTRAMSEHEVRYPGELRCVNSISARACNPPNEYERKRFIILED